MPVVSRLLLATLCGALLLTAACGVDAPGTAATAPAPNPATSAVFPDAASTGVAAGTSLRAVSGNLVIRTRGTRVDGVDVLGGITVKADDVTITNARVRCVDVTDWCVAMTGRSGKLLTSEVGGGADGRTFTSATGVWSGGGPGGAEGPGGTDGGTQVTAVDVHHTSDGMRIDGWTTVADSYVHDLRYDGGAHSDGTTTSQGRHVVYRHNTFSGGTNCAIFLQQADGEKIADVVIDRNLLLGETRGTQRTSFGVCVDPDVTSVAVTGNVFGRGEWQVGPATTGHSWSTWSGNSYRDGTALTRP